MNESKWTRGQVHFCPVLETFLRLSFFSSPRKPPARIRKPMAYDHTGYADKKCDARKHLDGHDGKCTHFELHIHGVAGVHSNKCSNDQGNTEPKNPGRGKNTRSRLLRNASLVFSYLRRWIVRIIGSFRLITHCFGTAFINNVALAKSYLDFSVLKMDAGRSSELTRFAP